jgi:hypothetical protein
VRLPVSPLGRVECPIVALSFLDRKTASLIRYVKDYASTRRLGWNLALPEDDEPENRQRKKRPPFRSMTPPVMNEDASEARNKTDWAISSEDEFRPSGV